MSKGRKVKYSNNEKPLINSLTSPNVGIYVDIREYDKDVK